MLKNTIICTAGIIGTFISNIYGGWSAAMTTLLIFMAIDYITGVIVAAVFHRSKKSATGSLESRAGFKGLCRKGVMLFIVLVGYRLDMISGSNYIRDAVIIAFITNEIISIAENAGLMGIPMPKVMTKAIEMLKNKEEDHDA